MVDKELLDRVRCFVRVSTSFNFGLSAQPPRPRTPRFRLVPKGNTATLVDLLLISLPPPFFFCFPSYHAKRLRVLMVFICARETRGASTLPHFLAPPPCRPTFFGFLSLFPLLCFIWCSD